MNKPQKHKKSHVVQSWDVVFPNDANPHGTMFGGKLMAIMDMVAAIAASRYAARPVVTASTESIVFKRPVSVGDRIETQARVVWVGRSSMVVKVNVYSENPTKGSRLHCTTAHFNFVALDENGQPTAIPPLLISTEGERRDFEVAQFVKQQALERKEKLAQLD